MLIWRIWFIGNEIVHDKQPPPVEASKTFLLGYYDSMSNLLAPTPVTNQFGIPPGLLSHAPANSLIPWTKPPDGWCKLNTAGSFSSNPAGSGMILRNHEGSIVFSATKSLGVCRDELEAELHAIMEGLSSALHRVNRPLLVETDSYSAYKMIKSLECDTSAYAPLVREIKLNLSFRETCVTHATCNQNKVSRSLASFDRIEGRTMTWIESGPPAILELATADCNPVLV
ncbi:hypothetical protein D1007_12782 [Hordeum vulgare]|nr:hypothetical protein D1007_12782 [Hordeum vulgare]